MMTIPYIQPMELGSAAQYIHDVIADVPRHVAQHVPYVAHQVTQANIPVPEFSGIALVTFSALAASLYLLRRRRR